MLLAASLVSLALVLLVFRRLAPAHALAALGRPAADDWAAVCLGAGAICGLILL